MASQPQERAAQTAGKSSSTIKNSDSCLASGSSWGGGLCLPSSQLRKFLLCACRLGYGQAGECRVFSMIFSEKDENQKLLCSEQLCFSITAYLLRVRICTEYILVWGLMGPWQKVPGMIRWGQRQLRDQRSRESISGIPGAQN